MRFTTVRANIDLSKVTVNARTGEFNPTSLAHVVNTDVVNELVVRTWLDRACECGIPPHIEQNTYQTNAADRKSTLVFCVNLAHVAKLTAAFRTAGVDARYLHAKTPAAERKALVDAFRAGQYPVLVNCGMVLSDVEKPESLTCEAAVLTEGADVPNIDCVLVARPTRSRNVFAQMVWQSPCV